MDYLIKCVFVKCNAFGTLLKEGAYSINRSKINIDPIYSIKHIADIDSEYRSMLETNVCCTYSMLNVTQKEPQKSSSLQFENEPRIKRSKITFQFVAIVQCGPYRKKIERTKIKKNCI